ncbi:MAG: hypothetical protein LUC40_01140, partial [Oscillospiraceae bacterium]|nr:hypothetical protein [Oscillospiraceae bacterium]
VLTFLGPFCSHFYLTNTLRYNTLFAIAIVVYQLAPSFARAAFFHSRSERIYFSSHASGKAGEFLSVPVDRNVQERTGIRSCGSGSGFVAAATICFSCGRKVSRFRRSGTSCTFAC